MIDFLEGRLEEKTEEGAVINVGGLGLALSLSLPTLQELPAAGERIRLSTYLYIKEDLVQLYGFGDRRERDIFLRLLSVTGVGPRLAITLLSAYDPDSFIRVVATEDLEALTAVTGVGKKSGQRIILELKDKLSPLLGEEVIPLGAAARGSVYREARDALKGLGYSASEVARALEGYEPGEGEPRVEELVKHALKRLGGKQA